MPNAVLSSNFIMEDPVIASKEGLPHAVAVAIKPNDDQDVDVMKVEVTVQPHVICFRDLMRWDIPQVRQLHEKWFPIRYNETFYEGAAKGLWMETGGPLFARLAVKRQSSTPLVQSCLEEQEDEEILGVVTASTIPLSKVDDLDLIARDDWQHTELMYILTLGTRLSVRRMGIASVLLQECIAQACRQPSCGAVYLHVKADNVSARRFYEKNGFQNLRFLQDYYTIDGERHDAFLYICYVNGAASQQSDWFDLITRPLFALFSIALFGWKKLVEGLTADSFEDTAEKFAPPPLSASVRSANFVPRCHRCS